MSIQDNLEFNYSFNIQLLTFQINALKSVLSDEQKEKYNQNLLNKAKEVERLKTKESEALAKYLIKSCI